MNRILLALTLSALTVSAHGELRPPERTIATVTDPANVINDRGAKLELFPTNRATPVTDASGRIAMHRVVHSSADAPISSHVLGVVFNHAMQQPGYISGEIAFRLKSGFKRTGFSAALYPGLKLITKPDIYVVNARTATEFMKVMRRLQARQDVEWVEPTVSYGTADAGPTAR